MDTIRKCTIAAATAACAALAASSPAAAETTWRVQVWGPKRASAQAYEWYAKEVTAKTGGQMKFDFGYDKGKPTDSLESLKSGLHQAGYVCAQYYADKMPLTGVIELPMFAPDNIATLGRVELALADHPTIQAELKKWNAKILLPVALPPFQLMGTRRIAKVEDLKGAKLRIAPEVGKILEDYGASHRVMSIPDSVAALKSGEIDTIALPSFAFASYNVQDSAKYITDKISLGSPFCFLGASQKAWDALPAGVQKTMLAQREPAIAQFEDIYAREDAATTAAFKQKGLEFVSFSAADRARLVAKAIKYWQAWIDEREKQGLKGREVFEFTQAKIREFNRK
jgi:TRAP-type C4-dicarboxylate transport system substrate-binding protein